MAASVIDLTSVATVNSILGQVPGTDSPEIQREITAYSQNILTRTSRSFLSGVRSYSERYNGNGSQELQVLNYPVLAVASLSVNGIAIPASPDYRQSGFVIDTSGSACSIALIGGQGGGAWDWGNDPWGAGGWGSYGNAPPLGSRPYGFPEGIQNIAVSYIAGYTQPVYSESVTVAGTAPYSERIANYATFYQDQGVTLNDGTPLTAVASAPGPMQYVPPQWNVAPFGVYLFNAAQAAALLLVSYSYGAPPLDLSEAAARLVAEMYRKRQWIGQASQIQPGVGTTAYSKLEVEIGTAMTIQRYRRVFPA